LLAGVLDEIANPPRKAAPSPNEVMTQILGRPLEPWEQVYHQDGNHKNNKPANLYVKDVLFPARMPEYIARAEQILAEQIKAERLAEAREWFGQDPHYLTEMMKAACLRDRSTK